MSEENLTRIYTINLGKAWLTPRYRRTDRVVNMIKEFAQKHMKLDVIKIDQELNKKLWKNGKTNPPRKVRVKISIDDNIVLVSPHDEIETKKEDNKSAKVETKKEDNKSAKVETKKEDNKSAKVET
ncbi:MAG: 50S ribosomal protein L31e, partial [Nitrososphaeraceae archaeon]